MPLYAFTIFASAFLLFLLQLITAKQILPWFGGSAAIWITCLVFFQSVLLFGYAYSDWFIRRLRPNRQAIVHGVLLVTSLALLPIMPDASWKPSGTEDPTLRILALLAMTIGLPYFLLSATSPLIQAWFARTYPERSPYRLFALSNLASMLALLGYPLAIEPWLTTSLQAQAWSVIYVTFVALCCATAWHGLRATPALPVSTSPQQPHKKKPLQKKAVAEVPPTPAMLLLWVAFATMASFLLLAVTNHLSQNIASIPLLWVLPLSIYLLSFILCFEGHGWYKRDLFLGLLAVFLCAMAWGLTDRSFNSMLLFPISLFSAGLFVACMFCHGELNRLRPAPCYLTRFYLMVALGGALGALLVGIVAPLVLPGIYELQIGLVVLAALWLYQLRGRKFAILAIATGVLIFTGGSAIYKISTFTGDIALSKRNFYGALHIRELRDTNGQLTRRGLMHGTVLHGDQYPDENWRRTPTIYYRSTSGIGLTMRALLPQPSLRVGIIGLGAGTIAAYGKAGDTYRFYEINPEVIQIANSEFTYLKDSAANIETVLGDARLNLERESNQHFDVLVVDAFSGDAIPLHLISSEALDVYAGHLQPRGVIAFHVTNTFIDLVPVVLRLADAHGMKAAYVVDSNRKAGNPGDWVLLTKDQAFLDLPYIKAATIPIQPRADWKLWTDDFNNLLQVLK